MRLRTPVSNVVLRSRNELDLADLSSVRSFFEADPEHVFLAAAKVGGILANSTRPADFYFDNLLVDRVSIRHGHGVKKLLFLGGRASTISPQPIREDYLLTGDLEPTNEGYAVAEIAGIVMCRGYNGSTHPFYERDAHQPLRTRRQLRSYRSHVLPALIRRFHDAKVAGDTVVVWGTGSPRREFLHVDDLADASIHLMRVWAEPGPDGSIVGGPNAINEIVNVGYGDDIPIGELAKMVERDRGLPGNAHVRYVKAGWYAAELLDSTRLHSTGWSPKVPLRHGLERTYDGSSRTTRRRDWASDARSPGFRGSPVFLAVVVQSPSSCNGTRDIMLQ